MVLLKGLIKPWGTNMFVMSIERKVAKYLKKKSRNSDMTELGKSHTV